MNHRESIETQHRQTRVKTATDPDAVRLAEVESAVIASKTALETEEVQMRADGKYADGYIDKHMANRKTQSLVTFNRTGERQ